MLGTVPAASFTAATTAPAALSALDALNFAGRHMPGLTALVTVTATVLVVLLVGWSFRRDVVKHDSAAAVRARWEWIRRRIRITPTRST